VLKSREITIVGEMPDLYVVKSGISKDKIVLKVFRKQKMTIKLIMSIKARSGSAHLKLKVNNHKP
jgi:membrane fusion protein (multidrug efflux system)